MKRRPSGSSSARRPRQGADDIKKGQVWTVLGLIALLGACVYGQVHQHEFVDYDDIGYFIDDPRLDGRLTGDDLVSAFAEPYFANWSPITSISIRVGDAIHGAEPGPHILTNVVLHLLTSMGLFLALVKMTRKIGASAFVGLVFALHPLHVESVAWASERKDVLAAVFWIASILAYGFYTSDRTRSRQAVVVLLGGFAMLSKPTAVTLPLTLVLLDFWPLGRVSSASDLRRSLLDKIPLLLGALLLAGVTFLVQDNAGARQTEWLTIWDRLLNAGLSYVTYIADTFWPSSLAIFYPYPDPQRLASWQPLGAWASLLVLTSLFMSQAARRPYLAMGWTWFIVTLVPMIGFVQVGTQGHADRYMYIPMIGLLIAVAWGFSDLLSRRKAPQWLGAALAAGVLAPLGIAAHKQVEHWRNTVALFSHALEATGPNAVAHRGLGVTYWLEGERTRGEQHLRAAIELDPNWSDARLALALALNHSGRFEEAKTHLLRARDDGADPGRVHAGLGLAAQQLGKDRRAEKHYRAALELRPDEWEIVNNLAWLLATTHESQLRDAAGAVALAERAVASAGGNPDFLETLATAYAASGLYAQAHQAQERALHSLPHWASTERRAQLEDKRRAYWNLKEKKPNPGEPRGRNPAQGER